MTLTEGILVILNFALLMIRVHLLEIKVKELEEKDGEQE